MVSRSSLMYCCAARVASELDSGDYYLREERRGEDRDTEGKVDRGKPSTCARTRADCMSVHNGPYALLFSSCLGSRSA